MTKSLDSQIDLAITLHVSRLREDLQYLTFQQLSDVLNYSVWKEGRPRSLSESINDIHQLTSENVVKILSILAQINGYYSDISEYEELFGGNNDEKK